MGVVVLHSVAAWRLPRRHTSGQQALHLACFFPKPRFQGQLKRLIPTRNLMAVLRATASCGDWGVGGWGGGCMTEGGALVQQYVCANLTCVWLPAVQK